MSMIRECNISMTNSKSLRRNHEPDRVDRVHTLVLPGRAGQCGGNGHTAARCRVPGVYNENRCGKRARFYLPGLHHRRNVDGDIQYASLEDYGSERLGYLVFSPQLGKCDASGLVEPGGRLIDHGLERPGHDFRL